MLRLARSHVEKDGLVSALDHDVEAVSRIVYAGRD